MESETCRMNWTYTANIQKFDDSLEELPIFLRFYPEHRTFYLMPHSKDQIGDYKVYLTATETTEGFEQLFVEKYVQVQV